VTERRSRQVARALFAGTTSGLALCLLGAAAVANGVPSVAVVPIAVVLTAAAIWFLGPRVPQHVVDAASLPTASRWRVGALWALSLVALLETTRLAAYMTDRPPSDAFAWTHSKFVRNHSCGTSYYEGALNIGRVENVYDPELYRPPTNPGREVEGFRPDPYQYPPPFVLIAAPIAHAVSSYVAFRGLWFMFIGGIVLGAFWTLAAWLEGETSGRLAWIALLAWLTIPVQMTLQMGNFQLGAIALSVLGMIAIRRGKITLGAALLGLLTVSKVFPGVLLVYLLVRKEYRAFLIAVVSSVACVALAALAFGPGSLRWFALYQLPRLDTGEALPGLVMQGPIAINSSVPGVVVKLQLLGLFLSRSYLSAAGWLYTIAIVALTVRAGRQAPTREQEAAIWLALLGLTAMRSPFLPHEYGTFPAVWIAALVLASARSGKTVLVCGAAFVAFNCYIPGDVAVSPLVLAVAAGLGQAAAVLLFGWTLLRRSGGATIERTSPLAALR
jgi:alpha-1,2-mannosyltransferase